MGSSKGESIYHVDHVDREGARAEGVEISENLTTWARGIWMAPNVKLII